MSQTAPFSGPMTRHDALLIVDMGDRQVWGDYAGAFNYAVAAGATSYDWFGNSGAFPSMLICYTPNLTIVSITGTVGSIQWVGNVIGSGQAVDYSLDGALSVYFRLCARQLYGQARPKIQAAGKPVVFIGHSLGGAVAMIMGAIGTTDGLTVQGAYTAAAPRPGDATFASTYGSFIYRLEAADDPVPGLPPETWVDVTLTSLFGFLAARSVDYVSPGTGYGVDSNGVISSNPPSMLPQTALAQILAGNWRSHLTGVYKARLLQQWGAPSDLVAGAYGYPSPWILGDREAPPNIGKSIGPPPAQIGGLMRDFDQQVRCGPSCVH